ncbi:alpha/beta fold hydrolase, partial [Pseudanabaenaceae cyanobacterium LEGE 13415]|nr:alpha/beta fold hydrolase [Pseudanabaenaceae cyanobacterium LEGE 13415]
KARQLRDRFQSLHLSLEIPDLNQDDFQHLTLTRQIQQVKNQLSKEPVTLIGSSFGGLTAAWIAQECSQVDRIILLAPAFNYLNHWLPTIAPSELEKWRDHQQPILVYHYAKGKPLALDYGIVADLTKYDESQIQRAIPTLILHGIYDETIPIAESRSYAKNRSWVELIELESDHALVDQEETIWQAIQRFCGIET